MDTELELKVYNLAGVLIENIKIEDYKKNIWLLNTAHYKTGLYVVEISKIEGQILFKEKLSIIK